MNSPTIIPNLYCSWYISGGPTNQTVRVGQPPQIQNGSCPGVGYLSLPVNGQIGFFSGSADLQVVKTAPIHRSGCPVCGR